MLLCVVPLLSVTWLAGVVFSQQENPPNSSSSQGSQGKTQQAAAAHAVARPRVQLLNAREGHEIVEVTRAHEPASRATQDCSHLVHQIYERAGFPYAYASSFDLYAGSESFARVKGAQAGDLIVWPGHVGIVANAREHLFYSLVRSGLNAEDYESRYWRSRGRARFYRYVVAGRGTMQTAAASGAARSSAADGGTKEAAESSVSAREASERTAVYEPAERSSSETRAAAIPRSIVVAPGHKQPTREQVSAGISELSSASGAALRADTARSAVPLIVFDQLEVSKVELKRDHGWAFVDLRMRASLWGEEADMAAHNETVRWELRRGKSGWEAVAPADRTFVPRDVAARSIAARIADLTQQEAGDREGSRREAARLTKLLGALLEESRK